MFRYLYVWLPMFLIYKECSAIFTGCDYYQSIGISGIYSITNPNYPNKYNGSSSCRWHAVSNGRLQIVCNEFDIYSSPDCRVDSFNVFPDIRASPYRYCGTGSFSKESYGKEIVITLETSRNTQGGLFHCYFKVLEEVKCRCGWKNPMKIVGGRETGIHEYPMMVGITNHNSKQVFCGGSIIGRRYVLTAAHCLNDLTINNTVVIVGEHNIATPHETNATRLHSVAKISIHPSYVSYKNDYDVAVITIIGVFKYTNEVGPVCLPFQHHRDSFGGSFVKVLGWGTTEFAGKPSNTLQEVELTVLNNSDCKKIYPDLQNRQICTFGKEKDACQFDSGGPVLWQNPTTKRLLLIGIISYGSVCASQQPGVNSRVSSFIGWIVQVTSGAQYCQAE